MTIQVSFQWLGLDNFSEDVVLAAYGSDPAALIFVVLGLAAVFVLALTSRWRSGRARLEDFGGYDSSTQASDQPLPVFDVGGPVRRDLSPVTMAALARGLIPPETNPDEPAVAPVPVTPDSQATISEQAPSVETAPSDLSETLASSAVVEEQSAGTASASVASGDNNMRYTPLTETVARLPTPGPDADKPDIAEVRQVPSEPPPSLPAANTVPRALPASAYAGASVEMPASPAEPAAPQPNNAPSLSPAAEMGVDVAVSDEERRLRYIVRRLRKRGALYRARLADDLLGRVVAARQGVSAPPSASELAADFETGIYDVVFAVAPRTQSDGPDFEGPLPFASLRVGHPDVLRRARSEQQRALDVAIQNGRTYRVAAIRDTLRRLDETLERIAGRASAVAATTVAPHPTE